MTARRAFHVLAAASALALPATGDAAAPKVNQAPSVTVALTGPPSSPGAPTTGPWRPNSRLTAKATPSDPNGDKVNLTYVWSVNGVVQQTDGPRGGNNDNFSVTGIPMGGTVSVTVTPSDATLSGTPVTVSGSIINHPPVATVSIGGNLRQGGQAVATVTASDADNDKVTFSYVWSVNGAVQKIDANKPDATDDFDLGGSVRAGDVIAVRVVPFDGYVNGTVAIGKATVASAAPAGVGASQLATVVIPPYDPSSDPYSMANTTLFTGAQAWWNAGFDGSGVDVAVIDTGVSPVHGLDGSGKIVNGPDLSIDSQNPKLTNLDSNGHGTFMAGLIAGSSSDYRGMAPGARIVNVKVGATDGEVDVTQVIAAIDWVVQHAHDNGLNIRVISLSYGTNSTQSYLVDPLAFAAEQAWKAGIVVVAAAGNTGFQQGAGAPGVADPGYDPYLISVGGYSTQGTSDPGDDRIGDYSASSPGCAPPPPAKPGQPTAPLCKGPDLVNVGSHLQGLRVPGSYVDLEHPEGRLGTFYFRGSGTSEATALTAGAIALVLDKYPQLNPDQAKAFITNYAHKLGGVDDTAQGAGEVDLEPMLHANPGNDPPQNYVLSTGTGSIEIARGSDHLTLNGVELAGEQDIFGHSIDTSALAGAEAQGSSWSGGTWNGSSWSGNAWSGNSWSGNSWSGNSWSGNSWSGNSWPGNSWSFNSWSGNSWSGNSWSGNSWSGNSWSGDSWSTDDYG